MFTTVVEDVVKLKRENIYKYTDLYCFGLLFLQIASNFILSNDSEEELIKNYLNEALKHMIILDFDESEFEQIFGTKDKSNFDDFEKTLTFKEWFLS